MNNALLIINTTSLRMSHQHFFYFDNEQNLHTTIDSWPTLQPFLSKEKLSGKAIELLLVIQFLVREENTIQISRESVSKKARRIAKRAAHLNELFYLLHEKGYLSFQYGGVKGRKQFIILNPQFFTTTRV